MEQSPPSKFKTLSLIYKTLTAGQLIFGMVATAVIYFKKFDSPFQQYRGRFLIMSLIIAVAGLVTSNVLFRRKIRSISGRALTCERLSGYRSANISRWALLEIPIVFCVILYLLTAENRILLITAFLFLYFLTTATSSSKAAAQLKMSKVEIEEVDNPAADN